MSCCVTTKVVSSKPISPGPVGMPVARLGVAGGGEELPQRTYIAVFYELMHEPKRYQKKLLFCRECCMPAAPPWAQITYGGGVGGVYA